MLEGKSHWVRIAAAVVAFWCMPLNHGMRAQVQIGEAAPYGTLTDVLGEQEDWIELWNAGAAPVSLNGLRLTDDGADWSKWPLPDVALAPDERLVVFASGRDVRPVHHWECPVRDQDLWKYHLPSGPTASDWRRLDFDDTAWLTGPGGFGYGDGDDGTVLPEADVVFLRRTFTVPDVASLVHGMMAVDYDDGCVVYLNGHELFRSETMMEQSVGFDAQSSGLNEATLYGGGTPEHVGFDPKEWLVEGANVLAVQVHNENTNSSDLSIRPFLAVARAEEAIAPFNPLPNWWVADAPGLHTNFKLKPGEPLILSDADDNIIDMTTLPFEIRSGYTLGRSGTGPDDWCWYSTPTPGANNGPDCLAGTLPSPHVVPASGHYPGPPAVTASSGTLSGPPGQFQPPMVLRYTTDGSEPTASSPVFTGTWNPGETIVLSIRAFAEGWIPSATVDRTYFVAEPTTPLERVSIVTHPDHLWDWETGIYVLGPNAGQDYPFMGANFWQPWSKESRLEWFDDAGDPIASARFDLEIHGGWSRAEPQRSFRIDFKPQYTGKLEHAVFTSKPDIGAFGNLNLRNGGQASWENKIQDAFLGELALGTHAVASAWRPVEVYLNGDYWGVYGAREKSDEQFVEDNFGWDAKWVDLHNQWVSLNGSPHAWEACVNPMLVLPSGGTAFREAFEDNFDVLSYFDYHIFEIHGQNVDWMTAPWGLKNFKYFRSLEGDGKWRAILYDLDACFGAWGTSAWEDYLQLTIDPPYPSSYSALFEKVLQDPELGCGFATRYCDLMATTFEPVRFNTRLTAAANSIAPAMQRHIDMWDSPASVDYWQYRLELLNDNNAARIEPSLFFVQDHFGFNGTKQLTLTWSPPFAGEVQVNGMSDLGTGWTAGYFGECPIQIAAIPGPGQGFLGWQDNLHTNLGLVDPADPFVEVELEGDDTFFAMFGPCMGGAVVMAVPEGDGLAAVIDGSTGPVNFQWYLEGEQVGSGSAFAPSVPGIYTLTASNGTCTLVAAPMPWPNDGTGPVLDVAPPVFSQEDALLVTPNPASGPAVLKGSGWGNLCVFGADGQAVHAADGISLPVTLPTDEWTPGVYSLTFTEGGHRRTARFVVR